MRPRSARTSRALPIRWQAYSLAALVAVAILFGGGGAEGSINNGAIQALAGAFLALLFASQLRGTWPLPKAAEPITWLLLALFLIIALQLVPLPPELWQSLPGRGLATSALALTGAADNWRPLSLDPEATRRVAATLLLPAAILYGILGSTRLEVLLAVKAVLAAAGLSALIGALQLTLNTPGWLTFYEGANPGAASGVFANPNHHAALLVAAMLLLAFLTRAGRSKARHGVPLPGGAAAIHPAWLALPFFVMITLATGSRTGVVLLVIAIPGALLIGLGRGKPLLWIGGFAAAILVVALTILFSPSGNALAVGESFLIRDDGRYSLIPDVLYTLRQYWPWGSGLGTFVPVFAPNENLDVAGAAYVNHAHNDWLEWLIESGAAGAIWLVAAIGTLIWQLWRIAANRAEVRGSRFAAAMTGALILLMVALHSLVDYPGRTAAISAVIAIAIGLIYSPLTDAPAKPLTVGRKPRWPLAAAMIIGLAVAVQVVRIFSADAAVRNDNGALAHSLRPQSGRALALMAEEQLQRRNVGAARQLASAAIARTPLNPAAVRVLAMTTSPAAALEPWRLASAMGWRDGLTQLWAFQQALGNGEFEVAAIRADAFLRTRSRKPQEYLAVVRVAAVDPRFRAALVERLGFEPAWRANIFQIPETASAEELAGTHELLRALVATDEKPSLGEIRSTIFRLIERQRYDAAVELYRMVRGGRPAGLLDDGSFDRPIEDYRTNSTQFDWLLRPVAGGTATIDEQAGRVLLLETDGNAALTLLRRFVPLAPGAYRLDYMRRGDAESPEALAISIRCVDGPRIGTSASAPLQGSGFNRRRINFDIGQNCPMIIVGFEAQAAGRPVAAEFDDFSLTRIP